MSIDAPEPPALLPTSQLGPFELLGFLGKGAMGQVWRARHREQGVAAAIKIVTAERAQRAGYLQQFRRETRAVAGLCHPGVVTVFDYGELTSRNTAQPRSKDRGTSPYLAMELCPRGSLANIERQLSFASIRSILLSLLDALAHAHARGVIHRDIKPANILLADDIGWTGVKLTDFGLAFVPEQAENPDASLISACGTPAYMAPEQFQGRWREFGPWTDLYSIGCLAFALVCGQQPYYGRSIVAVAKKHVDAPVPRLTPKVTVPDEFEGWVRRLLQKSPHERYQNAADAAWPLMMMDAAEEDEGDDARDTVGYQLRECPSTLALGPFNQPLASTGPTRFVYTTATSRNPRHSKHHQHEGQDLEEHAPEKRVDPTTAEGALAPLDPSPPPPPTQWQQRAGPRPSIRLLGAGLGLYGLRHIPLIGRAEERDALWQALLQTIEKGHAQAALIRGSSGVGKSFLAAWLCERAHESGAAIYLRATHGFNTSGGEGLSKMFARHFKTAGLDRSSLLERLDGWLDTHGIDDAYLRDGLAEVISPATEADVSKGMRRVCFARPEQRYALLVRVLGLIAQRRAVIVWLDDLQWSSTALDFFDFCLESDLCANLPVMVLGTVRDEAVPDLSEAKSKLARFALHEHVTHVDLGPLPAHEHADFIEKLLYLDPALARTVADRTAGNPLFAVQIVGNWASRGVLDVGVHGFVLADDERADVPDTVYDVWSSRLDEQLSGADDAAVRAFELAAVLGLDVDEREWRECLALCDAAVPEDEVQLLLQQRLLEDTDTGFRFAHSMLRETLVRRAKERQSFVADNRLCAKMLRARYADEPRLAERLGRHLLAARLFRDALEPLYEGAKTCGNAAELERCHMLLDLRREAIDALNAPDIVQRARCENRALRGLCHAISGDHQLAVTLAQEALELAEANGAPSVVAACCYRFAQAYLFLNEFEACLPLLQRGRELVETNQRERGLLMNINGVTGQALARMGRADEAITYLYAARDIAVDIGATLKLDNVLWALGSCERHRGNLAEAETLLREAKNRADALGHRMTVARTLISLGDVVRLQGRLDEAADIYRQVLAFGHSEEQHETLIGRSNLAMVAIQRAQYEEARPILDELQVMYEARQNRSMLLYITAMKLPCMAECAEWSTLVTHVDDTIGELVARKIVDADLAICLEICARICARSGRHSIADRLWEAAAAQWDGAGHPEKATAIRREYVSLSQ